ncbi:hypothetical protein PHYBOEH_001686 [Phytophthora boehmeriae]|uniref:Uncharacterized protein n=1 Tax=Phytophthora boehmeriae TaxID=109152 RepID=A0A8T1WTN6_9STRA|nr:hypothetical protein PHYBOEH_001686 [Phytophthora boehmeriae]
MLRPLVLGLVLPAVAQGAASCADCNGQTCVLDTAATAVTGGATSLSLSFCNYDTSKTDSYALTFGASSVPSCDSGNDTLPVLASLAAGDPCTADSCTVTATLKSAIDWAIALQNNGAAGTLTAQLTGNDQVATVGTFAAVPAAAMNAGTETVSVCATDVTVSGSRFSSVEKCNAVQVCRGAATDTACTTEVMKDAVIGDVSCDGEGCTGTVSLSQSLPCDGSSGSTALLVGVTVGGSTQSNFANVGSMTAPNFTIADASGLNTGSSELVLTTDTFCAASSIQLNVSVGDGSDDSSTSSVDVSSVNSTTNGTVVVELASPLSSTLAGEDVQLSLSQCGVSATGSFEIGEGSGDDTSAATGSTAGSEGVTAALTGSAGSVSTQETNTGTGLSHGMIVGIVIGAVALAGFVFEYAHHKKRQAMQPQQDLTANNVATPV